MITHRYLSEHFYNIPIYLWPLLIWRLWCVDRCARVWAPYFEGMGVN